MVDIDVMLAGIEGWLGSQEAHLLHTIASEIEPPQVIVEIGAYRGRSTIALAKGARVPVYSIDIHQQQPGDNFAFSDEDRAVWTANVLKAGVAGKVRPINLPSQNVPDAWTGEPVGFLFIDGAHSYDAILGDLEGWLPVMALNGRVAFHDSNSPQVQQVVAEHPQLELVNVADLTTVYRVGILPPKVEQGLEPAMLFRTSLSDITIGDTAGTVATSDTPRFPREVDKPVERKPTPKPKGGKRVR